MDEEHSADPGCHLAIDESGPAARFVLSKEWLLERKLFVQVNRLDALKEFVQMAASHFTNSNSAVLPRGNDAWRASAYRLGKRRLVAINHRGHCRRRLVSACLVGRCN